VHEGIADQLRTLNAKRILIVGGPRTGKTTLAKHLAAELGYPLRGTDELTATEWSAASQEASGWFREDGPWIFEGVVLPRAIRKHYRASIEAPADAVVIMKRPKVEQSPGQASMTKACATVLNESMSMLVRQCAVLSE